MSRKRFTEAQKELACHMVVAERRDRHEVAKEIGCSFHTLKSWLTDYRINQMLALSDEELLRFPQDEWDMFTPFEQELFLTTMIGRGLNLHEFEPIRTYKRQHVGTKNPWFHMRWATIMVNFGGWTEKDMAAKLGISVSTLSRWLEQRDEYGNLLHPDQYYFD